jgi:hypothetical protein
VLLPSAVFLLVRGLAARRVSIPLVSTLLGAQAVLGTLGTRDALRFNEMCAREYQALVASGVPARDIDAGWSFNGWMLYAHPENLLPGADRNAVVPQVTARASSPYALSVSPLPGYRVLRIVEWSGAIWPRPNRLWISQREEFARAPETQ